MKELLGAGPGWSQLPLPGVTAGKEKGEEGKKEKGRRGGEEEGERECCPGTQAANTPVPTIRHPPRLKTHPPPQNDHSKCYPPGAD